MRMLLVLVLIAACGKNNEPPPETSGVPNAKQESGPGGRRGGGGGMAPAEEARKKFDTLCQMCHGPDGMGNGPAAANLNPKPRNYTDPAWQASVTDDELRKTIVLGGQATGKSASMPGNPDLKDKPEVVDELVKIVRGFKRGDAPSGSAAPAAGSAQGSAAK
ncbi:MAG TPA: cytochrome c [Kofleriaceae bacterium]|jgi:cytochrome c553|nr:cytochrome c [Kofleriaceae bacterium]